MSKDLLIPGIHDLETLNLIKQADSKLNFTQWGSKYIWHVSMEPYPVDNKGYCQCQCEYCIKQGKHIHPVKKEIER